MAVAWEAVKEALAAQLPAVLPGTFVSNGPIVTDEGPSSYLTVACVPSANDESAGSFQQNVGPDGFSVTESGTVECELASVTGSSSVPSAFTAFGAIASFLQANQTLGGVLSQGSTVSASAQVLEAQTTSGGVQRLLVSINYFTRI